MERFYFDIDDGKELVRDDEGVECSDMAELRFHAIDVLPDIVREELPDGDRRNFVVKVRRLEGDYLFQASLSLDTRWFKQPD